MVIQHFPPAVALTNEAAVSLLQSKLLSGSHRYKTLVRRPTGNLSTFSGLTSGSSYASKLQIRGEDSVKSADIGVGLGARHATVNQ